MELPSRNSPHSKTPERIVVTGIGVVTPQGCSTWSSALSLRFRKSAWCEHETVLVADDPCGIAMRGATISRVPEERIAPNLDGAQRAVALSSPAIKECLAGLPLGLIGFLDCRVDNFIVDRQHDFFLLLHEGFPGLRLPFDMKQPDSSPALGRCTFFQQIIQATEELRAGTSERIMVGCVDSLCATSWLMSVRDQGVLKDSFTPEGIIAGEAAGAVLLERESAARRRNAPVLAVVSSWGSGTETKPWNGPAPATGAGLTEAFDQAFCRLDDGGKSVVTVIADLNGERHRALDWAYAEGRIFPQGERERELRHPAFIIGDCGGATGAVMLADALGRFTFHPRFMGRVALTTSDQGGTRRLICLERGDDPDRLELMEQIRTQMKE